MAEDMDHEILQLMAANDSMANPEEAAERLGITTDEARRRLAILADEGLVGGKVITDWKGEPGSDDWDAASYHLSDKGQRALACDRDTL